MPDFYINDWPPFSTEDDNRVENVLTAARMMVNAAYTAPVTGGMGSNEAHIVYGQKEREQLAKKMEDLAFANPKNKHWKNMFKLEAAMVREETDAIVFIGNFRAANDPLDYPCGRCGGVSRCWVYDKRTIRSARIDLTESRQDTLVNGPLCMLRVQALGYAVASAVYLGHQLLVDCRPMMSLGIAGQHLEYCPKSSIVVGIGVAARDKNPYVDVRPDYHVLTQWQAVSTLRRFYYLFRQAGFGDYRHIDPLKPQPPTPPEISSKKKASDEADQNEGEEE